MQSFFAPSLLIIAVLGTAGAAPLALTRDGDTDFVITVGADAIAPEITAANELKTHLEAVTGATFEIREEALVDEAAPQIVVGPTARFRAAFPDIDLEALGHDGIVMKTAETRLYLAGGRPRGTLYAVYTFLEDQVGCRWWTATESHMPDEPSLQVDELDTVYVPRLQYREAFYRGAFSTPFAPRLKCNGHFAHIPPEYGGHYNILGWCHTFNQLLPPEEYFEQHPEWYSLIDGKRVHEGAQLCLTNDEMREELTRRALEWVRKDPTAGIISISQNDCWGPCQCDKCQAVVKEEGAESGPLVRFVNQVAEDINKEFPGTLIETLAYVYSRQAPKLARPSENVVIRLCSIECSFVQPLTGPQNEKFRTDIEQWSAMAPQLYIWNYVTNFRNYILPHPNMRALAPDIRFFVDHNTIGLFEQGDAGSSCGDFVELRAWLLSHLMWDPSLDDKALIAEFLQGYYGPAAEPLQQYIDVIHDAAEASGAYLGCYLSDTSAWLGLDDLNRATELFNQATEAVAEDPVIAPRVRRARLPLDHAWLLCYSSMKRQARAEGKPFLGPEDPQAAADEYIATCRSFDVGQYREGAPFEGYVTTLEGRFRDPGPAPERCKDLPETDWILVEDHEFSLANPGGWVSIVEDAKAANGYAARMTTDHTQWATQFPVSADIESLGPCRLFASIRCDLKAQTGNAFDIGIYDNNAKAGVMQRTVPIAEVADGQYQEIDLGVHELTRGMYFWAAPVNNPDEVEGVYVDRIYCVKEPQ